MFELVFVMDLRLSFPFSFIYDPVMLLFTSPIITWLTFLFISVVFFGDNRDGEPGILIAESECIPYPKPGRGETPDF